MVSGRDVLVAAAVFVFALVSRSESTIRHLGVHFLSLSCFYCIIVLPCICSLCVLLFTLRNVKTVYSSSAHTQARV